MSDALVLKGIDLAINVLVGDKLAAHDVTALSNLLLRVHKGELSPEDARASVRSQAGDALDQIVN